MISIDRGQAYFICVFYGKFMVMNFISNFMSVLNNGRNLNYEFLGIFRLVFEGKIRAITQKLMLKLLAVII